MKNTILKERRKTCATPGGFTLVELLTVMAIVSILLSVAAVGISRIDRGQATTTSLALTEALFNEARALAIGEGTRTRVVIHNDLNDSDNPDRYLRYLAIAVEEKNSSGTGTGNWTVASRGTLLPSGVFFDHDSSKKVSAKVEGANPMSGSITGFGEWNTGTIDFPGLPRSAQSCYYYEYNSEGICVAEGSSKPGGAFVVSQGSRGAKDSDPILDDKNKTGFVIWRNGSTSIYRNTKDL